MIGLIALVGWLLRGAKPLNWAISAGLLTCIIVFGLSVLFSPEVFSQEYWHFPQKAWKWVGGIVALQSAFLLVTQEPQEPVLRAVITVGLSPVLEEVVRAVIVVPLAQRWGVVLAVTLTGVVLGSLHSSPYSSTIVEAALSAMFIYTDRSIPATSFAHLLINAIALAAGGLR